METSTGFKTKFLEAAFKGDFPLLQSLAAAFENGQGPGKVSYADFKTADDECNALFLAAAAGNTLICRFLVQKMNFDVNGTNEQGETPLFRAIHERHQPTAIFLIDNGADVNIRGRKGITPLHHAAAKESLEIIMLLVSKGSDLHATAQAGMPLHYAAVHGNFDALRFLLDLKADPNFISPLHTTPLLYSVSAKSIECMELLVKAGADPNEDCSQSQITPLCLAVCKQDEEMIRYLLKAGADPNKTDLSCKTPLEYAALKGFREVVELLFPVTSPIACHPDWSINGIMQHEQSKEVMEMRNSHRKELYLWGKAKGKEAFERNDYLEAMLQLSSIKLMQKYDKKGACAGPY